MTLYSGDEFYGDEITSPDDEEKLNRWKREKRLRDAEEYLKSAAEADDHSSDLDPGTGLS